MRAHRGHTEGKNFVWKIYCFFPLNLRVLSADSDGNICKKWMQNALRFVMKNRSFSSLINNFKIRIKSYLSKRKNFYFSSEIWGRFAFTFCRYFHQNLQVLPSESVAGNTFRFRGKFQYIFQTKFFPLEFEGISYNSVEHYRKRSKILHGCLFEGWHNRAWPSKPFLDFCTVCQVLYQVSLQFLSISISCHVKFVKLRPLWKVLGRSIV